MSWFSKDAPPGPARQTPSLISLNAALESAIVDFLVKHGRMERREGRQLLQVIATTSSPDGGTDYVIRTRVPSAHGTQQIDSHLRIHADNRIRLIR